MKIEIRKLTDQEIQNIRNLPIWTCEISEFDWFYDEKESCFLLEGEVEVETETGIVKFGAGDFVVFPKGLKCRWKVIKPVRKHYSFG
ncbi:MAG: cupin domain-containing protein [Candidatus Marinimicrobia bacterium]|nr:cupin domain-containing protein [Candidatus Neomarinimicrobiota bacterium]